MPQRSAPQRAPQHRRKRRVRVPSPAVLGSLAVVAAASGALTMPHAGASPYVDTPASVLADTVPARPAAETSATGQSATASLVAAQRSIAASSAETAKAALAAQVEQERQAAAERAARAEREARMWVVPTSNYRVTATFGSGGSLWASGHTGMDMATASGTAVLAASSGTIVSAGYDGPFGNKIAIQHADGTVTWYAHLSAITRSSGTVATGEVIGAVGSTGNSTGPHLHFEVRPGGGDPVDPRAYLRGKGLSI